MEMLTRTILVLDPDAAVGALIKTIIEENHGEHYRILTARSLAEAAKMLGGGELDLIVTEALDQHSLFEFDDTFLVKLRSQWLKTPIVLCSSYPSVESIRPGEYDLAEVVIKPFAVEELEKKVDRALAATNHRAW